MKTANPTTAAAKRYKIQLAIAMVAYAAILFGSIATLERTNPQGLLRYALVIAPVIPVLFLIPIMARFFRDTDELERRLVTEAFAIGAGITALLSVTYGFLENAGLPHLSAWWTWSVLMGSAFLARPFLNRRYS